jgi:hypothetical protein
MLKIRCAIKHSIEQPTEFLFRWANKSLSEQSAKACARFARSRKLELQESTLKVANDGKLLKGFSVERFNRNLTLSPQFVTLGDGLELFWYANSMR